MFWLKIIAFAAAGVLNIAERIIGAAAAKRQTRFKKKLKWTFLTLEILAFTTGLVLLGFEAKQSIEHERERRQQQELATSLDDPITHLRIVLNLSDETAFTNLCPFLAVFELLKGEPLSRVGMRVSVMDANVSLSSSDHKRVVAFYCQTTSLRGSPLGDYAFNLLQEHCQQIHFPLRDFRREAPFQKLRDLKGIDLVPYLDAKLLDRVSSIQLIANNFVILEEPVRHSEWEKQSYSQPPLESPVELNTPFSRGVYGKDGLHHGFRVEPLGQSRETSRSLPLYFDQPFRVSSP